MRLRLFPQVTPQPDRIAGSQGGGDRLTAEALLGWRHPLADVLRRTEVVFEQLVSATAAQAAGLVFFSGEVGFGLLLAIAALGVQLALGYRLLALRGARRELCVQLIVEGRAALPLRCVERERRRLLDPRTRKQLADSVDGIVDVAGPSFARSAVARPLFDVRVVRPLVQEFREVAALLRGDEPGIRGVAAVERLLSSAATPLYGLHVEPLRRELGRVRYLLGLTP
jgi:hypothetical protein